MGIVDGQLAEIENASSTISQAGAEEVTQASVALVTTAVSSHDPSAPEEATTMITSQASAVPAYRDAASVARLYGAGTLTAVQASAHRFRWTWAPRGPKCPFVGVIAGSCGVALRCGNAGCYRAQCCGIPAGPCSVGG